MVTWLLRAWLCLVALPALAAPDLLAEAELDVGQVRVHAQAVYRVRFLHAVDVRDVRIAAPALRLANLYPIGPDRVYEAQRGATRYRVHERQLAVFPFAAGTLALSGGAVTGRVPTASGSREVRLELPARSLIVLPAAAGTDTPWLPANALSLTEQWQDLDGGMYRRTVRMEATGVEAAQLPELRITVPGMHVLAGAVRRESRFAGERLIGISEQVFTLAPARPGQVTVPAVQIPWWNVNTDSATHALLPERVLFAGETSGATANETARASDLAGQRAMMSPGAVFMTAVVASALFLIAFMLFRHRTALVQAWLLQRAARTGDVRGVRDGLLAWEARRAPLAPLTLAALAARLSDPASAEALRTLERSLYGPAIRHWTTAELVALVSGVKRDRRRQAGVTGPARADSA